MKMTVNKLNSLLRKLGACPESVKWAKPYYSLQEAWEKCERADWMVWLVGIMADKPGWTTRQEVVLATCACARTVLYLVKNGENAPRFAIETAERWADGKATIEEVRNAADAAADAADAADDAARAAAYTADAAAYTADAAARAAAYAAHAAHAAACAADAADAAGAVARANKDMANIVREHIPAPYIGHDQPVAETNGNI